MDSGILSKGNPMLKANIFHQTRMRKGSIQCFSKSKSFWVTARANVSFIVWQGQEQNLKDLPWRSQVSVLNVPETYRKIHGPSFNHTGFEDDFSFLSWPDFDFFHHVVHQILSWKPMQSQTPPSHSLQDAPHLGRGSNLRATSRDHPLPSCHPDCETMALFQDPLFSRK